MNVRLATPNDAAAIAAIYNQGIAGRTATFDTDLRSDEDIRAWFDGVHPVVVVTDDAGAVIAFARASAYSPRTCYQGVLECVVYTDFAHRRRGAGMMVLRELVTQARTGGAWKLLARIFVDNEPSRMLVASLGFREVGVHHRHAKLDGRWRDVVVVEKFLAPTSADASVPPPPSRTPRAHVIGTLRSDDAASYLSALESARSLIGVYRTADPELLEAIADACFASKLHDATARARFIEVLREYATISRDAARSVDEALFTRLARMSVARDLDAFYEVLFVVKQIVVVTGDAARTSDLAAYRGRVLVLMKEAIELPRTMRGRISPGNVASLLMTLALAGCQSDADKREVAELAAEAKDRHRVEPPASVRPPPPAPARAAVARPEEAPPPAAAPKRRKPRGPADPMKPKKKRPSRAKT